MSDDAQLSESVPVTPALPDRADAPVSEITERFLRAVITEIPLDCIEELHLFSPLRQGTLETGIAVLAARSTVSEAQADGDPEVEPELPFEAEAAGDVNVEAEADTDASLNPDADSDLVIDHVADATGVPDAVADVEETSGDAADENLVDDASDDVLDETVIAAEADSAALDTPPERPERHTVYTARYRYIIKGPERGKWESSVKAEADAPLVTVETVVRGVQRRAGEESEIVRYSAAQIARALRVTLG
ncbi:hypothetical protein [Gemmatimonas aurantiaca]|uniref:hypothetical protein n=1 Tax=Gemmatimonas aurantiaca TaxID=173480 RepID=UPI00301CC058